MTLREEVIRRLEAIIDWTIRDGQLKSDDHRVPKRLAEEALALLTPPFDRDVHHAQ
jgi:hypothetical protein